MATKRQVETKLRELIRRLDRSGKDVHSSLQASLPDPRVIQVTIPDLEATYWTTIAKGRMDGLHKGESQSPDIRVRLSSDDLVALVDGQKSLFSSYLAGHIKVEANLMDLLRLRRLA